MTNDADKDGYGEHVYDNDADTDCNTCGYERTAEPPAHTHSWAKDWSKNESHHWHECTAAGCDVTENSGKDGYGAHDYDDDADTDCNTCGYVRTITPSHTHSWATEWNKNETHHWHECTGEGICNVTENSDKDGYAKHTASNWITDTAATATTAGTKHKECTVCHRVLKTGTIPATGDDEHTHRYGLDWDFDSINHWKECSCGDEYVAAHRFKWVVDKEATATKKGFKHQECTVCGYQSPAVEIPAAGSTTKPADPTKNNPNTGALDDVPQTGDNSNMILWIVLLLASGLGVTGTVVYSKRKKYVK